MRFPRPIQRAFDLLAPELRRIADSLDVLHKDAQQYKDAVDTAEKSEDQDRKIRQKWHEQVSAKDQEAVKDSSRRDDRNYSAQSSIRWATWIAAIGALIYGGIAAKQLGEMQRATEASSRASQTAVDALEYSSSQFDRQMQQTIAQTSAQLQALRLDHRASIAVKLSGPNPREFVRNQPIVIPLDVSNIGRTTANNLKGTAATYLLDITVELGGRPETWEGRIAYGALFPGDSRAVPSEILNKDKTPLLLTDDIAGKINGGKLIVLTRGRIEYDDMFGKRWTQFCFLTGPLPTKAFTAKEKICNAYNQTDNER